MSQSKSFSRPSNNSQPPAMSWSSTLPSTIQARLSVSLPSLVSIINSLALTQHEKIDTILPPLRLSATPLTSNHHTFQSGQSSATLPNFQRPDTPQATDGKACRSSTHVSDRSSPPDRPSNIDFQNLESTSFCQDLHCQQLNNDIGISRKRSRDESLTSAVETVYLPQSQSGRPKYFVLRFTNPLLPSSSYFEKHFIRDGNMTDDPRSPWLSSQSPTTSPMTSTRTLKSNGNSSQSSPTSSLYSVSSFHQPQSSHTTSTSASAAITTNTGHSNNINDGHNTNRISIKRSNNINYSDPPNASAFGVATNTISISPPVSPNTKALTSYRPQPSQLFRNRYSTRTRIPLKPPTLPTKKGLWSESEDRILILRVVQYLHSLGFKLGMPIVIPFMAYAPRGITQLLETSSVSTDEATNVDDDDNNRNINSDINIRAVSRFKKATFVNSSSTLRFEYPGNKHDNSGNIHNKSNNGATSTTTATSSSTTTTKTSNDSNNTHNINKIIDTNRLYKRVVNKNYRIVKRGSNTGPTAPATLAPRHPQQQEQQEQQPQSTGYFRDCSISLREQASQHNAAWLDDSSPGFQASLTRAINNIKWSALIEGFIPGRVASQAASRWKEALDPRLKKGNWSVEEDILLYRGVKAFGRQWCRIAEGIQGRTERQCRTRWVTQQTTAMGGRKYQRLVEVNKGKKLTIENGVDDDNDDVDNNTDDNDDVDDDDDLNTDLIVATASVDDGDGDNDEYEEYDELEENDDDEESDFYHDLHRFGIGSNSNSNSNNGGSISGNNTTNSNKVDINKGNIHKVLFDQNHHPSNRHTSVAMAVDSDNDTLMTNHHSSFQQHSYPTPSFTHPAVSFSYYSSTSLHVNPVESQDVTMEESQPQQIDNDGGDMMIDDEQQPEHQPHDDDERVDSGIDMNIN